MEKDGKQTAQEQTKVGAIWDSDHPDLLDRTVQVEFTKTRDRTKAAGGARSGNKQFPKPESQRGISTKHGRASAVGLQAFGRHKSLRWKDSFEGRPTLTSENGRRRRRRGMETGLAEKTNRAALLGVMPMSIAIRVRLGVGRGVKLSMQLGVKDMVCREAGQHNHERDQDERKRPGEEPGCLRRMGRDTVQTDCNRPRVTRRSKWQFSLRHSDEVPLQPETCSGVS